MASRTPFNGDYIAADGTIKNLMELGEAPANSPKNSRAPFNGAFYASDGSIHDVSELLNSGGGSGSSGGKDSPYDVIIRTQAEFEALYSSENWLGAASVAFVGDGGTLKFTRSVTGLKFPATVKRIDGFNNAIIEITDYTESFPDNSAAFWYAVKPETNDYSVNNLTVCCKTDVLIQYMGDGASVICFCNCVNLTNCTGIAEASSLDFSVPLSGIYATAFSSCSSLINCVGRAVSQNKHGAFSQGFLYCNNLFNCESVSEALAQVGYNVESYGYSFCEKLVNCKGCGDVIDAWEKPEPMDYKGYAFSNCSYLNGCVSGGSSHGVWDGTWLYRDDQSCEMEW